jgi:hypothetical protein
MRFIPQDPPRKFQVGANGSTTLVDCGRIELAPNEQVTFTTEEGGEYDVCRKDWGFYATPSLNGRLARFRIRSALVRNDAGQYFILLVEKAHEEAFRSYLGAERSELVTWLDETPVLDRFAARK